MNRISRQFLALLLIAAVMLVPVRFSLAMQASADARCAHEMAEMVRGGMPVMAAVHANRQDVSPAGDAASQCPGCVQCQDIAHCGSDCASMAHASSAFLSANFSLSTDRRVSPQASPIDETPVSIARLPLLRPPTS